MVMDVFTFYLPMGVTVLFFLVGVMASFVPILPAGLLIWLGVLIHKLWVPEESVSWLLFWVISGLVLFSQALDWFFTYWGAKRFGATWRGGVGAIVGIVVGPFVLTPIIGFVVGPVIGAVVGELLGGRELKPASKAGFGTIVGGLCAFAVKLGISCAMITLFFISTLMA